MRIQSSKSKKLIGKSIYTKSKLDKHAENVCDKGSKKVNHRPRLKNYMDYLNNVFQGIRSLHLDLIASPLLVCFTFIY